jgi:MoxR-like ATPase
VSSFLRSSLGAIPCSATDSRRTHRSSVKASSASLNALLTLLNERLFDQGSGRVQTPLLCLVAASNELPESDELDALYDRFMLRREVAQVSSAGLRALLSGSVDDPSAAHNEEPRLCASELQEIRLGAAAVAVPEEVNELLAEARLLLQQGGLNMVSPDYVSDRRMLRAVKLLQTAAFCAGRSEVSLLDCHLLEHVLWSRPDACTPLREWLVSRISSSSRAQQEAQRIDAELDFVFVELCRLSLGQPASGEGELTARLASAQSEAGRLGAAAAARGLGWSSPWLSPEEADTLSECLASASGADADAAHKLARDARLLELCLAAEAPPHTLALLLPDRWSRLARLVRESRSGTLRVAIPPCSHRIARSSCTHCLASLFT